MKAISWNTKRLITIFIVLSFIYFWALMPKDANIFINVIEFAKFHIICFLYGSFLVGLLNFLNLNFTIWKK